MAIGTLVRTAAVAAAATLALATPVAQIRGNRAAIAERLGTTMEQIDRIETIRGISDQTMARIERQQLPELLREIQYPDIAQRRAAFRRLQAVNEEGQIPAAAFGNAVRQLYDLRLRTPRGAAAQLPVGVMPDPAAMMPRIYAPPAAGRGAGRGRGGRGGGMSVLMTAGLDPDKSVWRWLGPSNIGGRTRAIAVDPSNSSTIWAASVGGGVWRSVNAGQSFTPVDDRMANLAVTTLAIDPKLPNSVCAGTGEAFGNGDALQGAGVFCTSDAVKWEVLPATLTADFQYVNRLAINANGTVMLAATLTGIHRSDSAGWSIWQRQRPGMIGNVTFHPTDPDRAIAGDLKFGRAYVSPDGGRKWEEATHAGDWNGRVELAYARKNPSVVYASVNNGTGEVWRSIDGGKSYTRRKGVTADGRAAPFLGLQGEYNNVIWAGDPLNDNLVLVGGIDLWKSTDGGETFVEISSWRSKGSAHSDHHAIVADPKYDGKTNRVVYFGNDGGIYRTNDLSTVGNNPDRTTGWTRLNNDYGVTQFYRASGSEKSGAIVGGTQDNGTLLNGGASAPLTWREMYGGDGGWTALDLTDERFRYGEYIYLNILRSDDGGKTTKYISGTFWDAKAAKWDWKPPPYSILDAQLEQALFIAPFVLDPGNPNRLLAGGQQLWRTEDARAPVTDKIGPKWTSIKGAESELISTLTVQSGNSDVVWVGHARGDVFRSDNATAAVPAWKKYDDLGAARLPNRYVTHIEIDPSDPKTVYVSFGGFSAGNIWKTTDGGLNWKDISAGLPNAPIRSVAVHPKKPGFVYLGMELGVFASEDGGTTWSATNEGPANCSVEHLFWMGTTLIAVTHGRGLFAVQIL